MKLGIHPQVDGKYSPSSRSINHNLSNYCHLSMFGNVRHYRGAQETCCRYAQAVDARQSELAEDHGGDGQT
jgi:hypothetical protein